MEFGINLFSIRNLLQTEDGVLNTMKELKKLGCSFVQCSGFKYDPVLFKRIVDECEMPIVLTHVPFADITERTDELCAEHLSFGCTNIGLGMMGVADVLDFEKFKENVAKLEAAAIKMEKHGCKFFYHHHHHEFYKHGGITAMDYMIENAPHINFTADTYWLQSGGVNINEFVERISGRLECAHLKDYAVKIDSPDFKTVHAQIVHLGEGNIDFDSVVGTMKKCGVKYFLVEQDNAADFADTMGEVKASFDYLKANF